MGELSIKIKIGDREYPMKVQPSEEERLRMAGRAINEKLKSYKEAFGIDDKQDLLAMIAFDCMVEKLKSESESTEIKYLINTKISNLDNLLSSALSE